MQLRQLIDKYTFVPFKLLNFLTAEINYGGRITDKRDQLLLRTLLKEFYNEKILNSKYRFANSPHYYIPQGTKGSALSEFLAYIQTLPLHDSPSILGLHENAQIAKGLNEGQMLLNDLLQLQPYRMSLYGISKTGPIASLCRGLRSSYCIEFI